MVRRTPRRSRRVDEGRYEAFDEIMVGDVIRWNGRLRKVRSVSRYDDDRVWMVGFAILRRSWTNRPYTVYGRPEIREAFGGIVAKGASLCTAPIECAVQREIEQDGYDRIITADKTVGLVW